MALLILAALVFLSVPTNPGCSYVNGVFSKPVKGTDWVKNKLAYYIIFLSSVLYESVMFRSSGRLW